MALNRAIGFVGVDAREDHDVGSGAAHGNERGRQGGVGGGVVDAVVGFEPPDGFQHAICRPLTHSSIAGVPGQLANLAGEVADRRNQDLTLVSRGLGRISDHGQGTAADQVELAGVLALLDDRVALRAPGGRAARDPLARGLGSSKLRKLVAKIAEAVDGPVGQVLSFSSIARVVRSNAPATSVSTRASARRSRRTGSGVNRT